MIIRENVIEVPGGEVVETLVSEDVECRPQEIIFFDLEHYVYKKPKCIGVFGACVYNVEDSRLYVTQYMIENKSEVVDILLLAKKYFMRMKKLNRKVIVTFSGNNDFTVIKYLFNKYNIHLDFSSEFETIDIQKEYEKTMKTSIGLKNLEKEFDIYREGELISGSNLAKTFHKVLKDKEYIQRMPKDKIENILLYNEQDVVNLYKIYITWNKFIKITKDEIEEEPEEIEEIEEIEEPEEIEEIENKP